MGEKLCQGFVTNLNAPKRTHLKNAPHRGLRTQNARAWYLSVELAAHERAQLYGMFPDPAQQPDVVEVCAPATAPKARRVG